jgi:hypothetical protein
VDATRLVDEISQGTVIRLSERASQASEPSGRLPEAYPGYASLPRPQYLQLMVPETMVELLAARFTKYHSSLVAGLLRCPGLARDLPCRALPVIHVRALPVTTAHRRPAGASPR